MKELIRCKDCPNYKKSANTGTSYCRVFDWRSEPDDGCTFEAEEKVIDRKTCKGCRHNVIVSGVQVCWRPFERGGDVHTVKAITDEHARCEHYDTKAYEGSEW